jgi:hypothetical protein
MSLLTVVNNAAAEISLGTGLTTYTTVVNNTDPNAVLFYALANRAGKELAEDASAAGYWQFLRKQYVFKTSGVGPYTCTITPNTTTLTNLSNTAGIAVGQNVYAVGLLNDTLVTDTSQLGSGTVGISIAPSATVTLTGQSCTFATENYPLPADFAYLIVQTEWDRNFRWQLLGPLDAQEWQVIKSGISPVGPRMRFRIMQGQFYINPVGSASTLYTDNIVYEYVSNQWVGTGSAPTIGAQTTFQADTDVSLINEELLTLGVEWRFLRARGLPWQDTFKDYTEKKDKICGRSASARNLPLNSRASGIRLLNSQNVPDTGFGS